MGGELGFTLVELLIELALEEVVVELASLTLGPEGRLHQTNRMQRGKSYSVGVLGADPPWRWRLPPRNFLTAPLTAPMPRKGSRS